MRFIYELKILPPREVTQQHEVEEFIILIVKNQSILK